MAVQFRRPGQRSGWARWFTPIGTIAILGYFGFHAFSGQYGVRAHIAFAAKERQLVDELTVLQERRGLLESRVLAMREGTIEGDMLEDRARRLLNLARTDEVLIAFD